MIRMFAGASLAALLLSATPAVAQMASPADAPPPPPGPQDRPHGPRPMTREAMMARAERDFARMDLDHDGKVTLEEARAAAARMFDRLDANRDGTIDPDERRMRGPDGEERPPMVRRY